MSVVRREAQKIARLASNALQKSFEEVRPGPLVCVPRAHLIHRQKKKVSRGRPGVGAPTWTGRFGKIGAPTPR